MKVVFVEPPKDFWFVMGEYLPPPTAAIQLAAFLELRRPDDDIKIIDCQAEELGWNDLRRRLEVEAPDLVAVSSLAEYPVIDAIVRGEGEITLVEVVESLDSGEGLEKVEGLTFRHGDEIISTAPRPMIKDLDSLPMPGYHFVEENLDRYHFKMMAGDKRYLIIEGSRGCSHGCNFCSQCSFWGNRWRAKSGKRIAEEMEYCLEKFDAEFLWLTDDNFAFGPRADEMFKEVNARGLGDELYWFVQARVDDVARNRESIPAMKKAGNQWILLGIESGDPETLSQYGKGTTPDQAHQAIRALQENDIFAQGTFIIGNRTDTHESIEGLRRYIEVLDPDLAIFMILTPFPGTELYEEAVKNSWIEDRNWANYDMIHAVMPTETLSTTEVQDELFRCYRSFYGKFSRRIKGLFASNQFRRRTYRHMASQGIIMQLRDLVS